MSIGQGFMLTTPLQLAVMSARIASRGKTVVPKLLKSIDGREIAQNIQLNQSSMRINTGTIFIRQ